MPSINYSPGVSINFITGIYDKIPYIGLGINLLVSMYASLSSHRGDKMFGDLYMSLQH